MSYWRNAQMDLRAKAMQLNLLDIERQCLGCMYPVTVFPAPFEPIHLNKAKELQKNVNYMMASIANDHLFLEQLFKNLNDPIVQQIYSIHENVCRRGNPAKYQLGIMRSDYMINRDNLLKQVEVNTISAAYASLAPKIREFHRYSVSRYQKIPLSVLDKALPENHPDDVIVSKMLEAHKLYMDIYRPGVKMAILFVINPYDYNLLDQKLLEWKLWEQDRDILVHRIELDAEVFATSLQMGPNQQLIYTSENEEAREVSLIYFRTGYKLMSQRELDARLYLEKSRAIKCPSVQLQMAGMKRVQLALTDLKCFESHCRGSSDTFSELYRTFETFYPLDSKTKNYVIHGGFNRLVLKTNNEGGGYNTFGESMIQRVEEILQRGEGDQYVLMSLIKNEPSSQVLLTANPDEFVEYEHHRITSELGIYGTVLAPMSGLPVDYKTVAGHLIRSKLADSNEVGISVGSGMFDSPFLIY